MKYLDEFPAIFFVTLSIRNMNTTTKSESHILNFNIAMATVIIVIADDMNMGSDCESI